MYNSEDTVWTNQQLYFFKDKIYNSNGFIDLTISNTTTSEFKYFTPPVINFKIGVEGDFNSQKHCLLNISKVNDLINSWNSIIKALSDDNGLENIEIKKRYNNDRDLIFKFKTSKSTNELCVIIGIFFNDSNFAKVIIPATEFYVIINILKQFQEDYINRCNDLKTHALLLEQLKLLKNISLNIKVGPSMIQEINNTDDGGESFDTINHNDELDSFIGGSEMTNVEIPTIEVDEEKASHTRPTSKKEVSSYFVTDVLKNDITVLEDILNSIYVKENPIEEFIKIIEKSTKVVRREDLLVAINNDDYKSVVFLSKLIFNSIFRNYIDNDVMIPTSFPLLKYKILPKSDNLKGTALDMAMELLTIHAYFKKYRETIELKTDDVSYTKAITHLVFRCFTDVFIFSHLNNNSSMVATSVMEKYDHFMDIGFFNKYNKNLDEHNLDIISREDILNIVNTLIDNVLSDKGIFVNELHDQYFKKGKVKLPSKNNLSLEQIINVVVKLEYERGIGKDITEILKQDIDEEIKSLYLDNKKENDTNKKSKSNLLRFINKYESEIPKDFKNDLICQIEKIGNKKYDIDSNKPPLKDLGDHVVKALHIWIPEEDPKIISNFNYFINKIESSTLTKSEIINLHTLETIESTSNGDDWGTVLGGI